MNPQKRYEIFLEVGKKKVFAGAVSWPGWCRAGRDEETALQTLFDYGPRYEQVVRSARLGFLIPEDLSLFGIVERVEGNATTDFGALDATLSGDIQALDEEEIKRIRKLLESCWVAFDSVVSKAAGVELRKGPRGGGRDLQGILEHVVGADEAYLKRIGWKIQKMEGSEEIQLDKVRKEILDGLDAAVAGELPTVGPRGGKRWAPRFFVRRVAWHIMDHAWEIEDRIK